MSQPKACIAMYSNFSFILSDISIYSSPAFRVIAHGQSDFFLPALILVAEYICDQHYFCILFN